MLDINYIRENAGLVRLAATNKQLNPKVVDEVLRLDSERRDLIAKVESIRAAKNKLSRDQVEEGRQLKKDLKDIEPHLKKVEEALRDVSYLIPNIYADDVPVGKDESENQVIRSWGEPVKLDFKPKDHVELGEALSLLDTKKASQISGARFAYLFNDAVMLEFALVQYTLSLLTNQETISKIASSVDKDLSPKTFIPVVPPVLIRPDVFDLMDRLKPEDERYHTQKDNLYLIGSAEHTLGPLHMGQTIPEKDLPIRYVGFSTSFRREAGSYGKDTRGILRLHQFDKIEMESFSLPEHSITEQNFFVAIQEYLMQQLNIPYQVIMICTGDMGKPDYRQIDINAWLPGQNKYRETHTSDLMTDFQARRLNTKFQRKHGETGYAHMNDATAFAIGRTLIAIFENYQQADGSIKIPQVLQPYMNKKVINGK